MKSLVEKVIENISTREVFLFRITCANCGRGYSNKPVRFSKADVVPATQNKKIIYDALYEQELQAVRQLAIRVAEEQMNFCPICKRLVCNQCFLICDDLDMCRDCAITLEENGVPVHYTVADIAT